MDWIDKKTYLNHFFKHWNAATLVVEGTLNNDDRKMLLKHADFLDRVIEQDVVWTIDTFLELRLPQL